jgi:hypothetical protein
MYSSDISSQLHALAALPDKTAKKIHGRSGRYGEEKNL